MVCAVKTELEVWREKAQEEAATHTTLIDGNGEFSRSVSDIREIPRLNRSIFIVY